MPTESTDRRASGWYDFQVKARRIFNRFPIHENQKIYILTLLIGVACGLGAVLFHLLLEFFQNNIIYRAAAIQHWWAIPLVIVIPTAGGLLAGAGLYFYAPEARGSGIPQVKKAYYLQGGRIGARAIWGKMFLSSLNIGTGASLGREGPTVQICAGIASVLGRMFALSRKSLRSLVPVGAAAGLAAAFNTPIAAVTFTMEEILGDSSAKPLGSIVIAAVISAVIERSILGELPLFSVPAYKLNSAIELVFYALLGVLSSVVSVTFNSSLLRLRSFFTRQTRIPQWATPGAGGLIMGLVGAAGLLLTRSSSIFGVGYGQLSVALQGNLTIKLLLILGCLKLAATVISYSSGSSGGIFGPSLFIGAMLGGSVGLLARVVLGPSAQPGAFALVGMGAVFAGIVRAPVTSIIIIFEMTGNYSIILPLMIANIVSYALASRISPTPIYEALLLQDGVHLPQENTHLLKQIQVSQAMTEAVITLDAAMPVAEAFKYVQTLPVYHHAYPILDGEERLVGILTFNDIKRAMAAHQDKKTLADLCERDLVHVYPDHALDTVILRLGKNKISQVPVVSRTDKSKLLGVITMHDVAAAIAVEKEDDELDLSIAPTRAVRPR